jgi:hypothetical protein
MFALTSPLRGRSLRSRLSRVFPLVAFLGSMLVLPAGASADQQQPTVVQFTLLDGTACRGPITGTTFTLLDQRANYACTDGRWIMGEPLTLGDGRQVAMLGRTILQGQRASDGADPCQQPTCIVGLGQVEVATTATLPRDIKLDVGGQTADCILQDGDTFYLGLMRANYLCPAQAWSGQSVRQDFEHWIVGSPFTVANNLHQVLLISLVRQASYTAADQNACGQQPICIYQVQNYALFSTS